MPQAVGILATPIFGSFTLGRLLFAIASFVIRRLLTPKPKRPELGEPPPQTLRVATPPVRWVVGRWHAFGVLADIREWSVSDDTRALEMTLLYSESPCDAIEYVWINEHRLTVTAGGTGGTMTLSNGGDGNNDDYVDAVKEVSCGLSGTTSPRRGIAWLKIRIHATKPENGGTQLFQGPPEISVTMRGVKTVEGNNPTWSANAATVTRWYMRHVRQIPADEIDATSFAAAVTYCNNLGLEAHGSISADEDPRRVMEQLTTVWGGTVVDDGEKWQFRTPVARTAAAQIDPKHVVADPVVVTASELSDRVNKVSGQYPAYPTPGATGVETRTLKVEDTAAVSADGGVLEADLGTLRFCVHEQQALYLLFLALAERKAYPIVTLTVPHGDDADAVKFLELVPGDAVTVNLLRDLGLEFTGQLVASRPLNLHELELTIRNYGFSVPSVPTLAAAVPTVAIGTDGTATVTTATEDDSIHSYRWELVYNNVVIDSAVTASNSWKVYNLSSGSQYRARVRVCGSQWGAHCSAWSGYRNWTQSTNTDDPDAPESVPTLTRITTYPGSTTIFISTRFGARVYDWQYGLAAGQSTPTNVQTTEPRLHVWTASARTAYRVRWRACARAAASGRGGPQACTVWSAWQQWTSGPAREGGNPR